MAPSFTTKTTLAAGIAIFASQANAYTLTAYVGKGCTGEVQQTIEDTKYGAYCNYFDDGAASVSVSGGGDDYQWIFFNQYPCDADSQVGSFLGNNCINQGGTKIKAVTNIIPEGSSAKANVESNAKPDKRAPAAPAGTITTWQSNDCSGAATNELQFIGENLPVTLNTVGSARVNGVPSGDTAFACTDDDCHVDAQVQPLVNGECANLEGKDVQSAMVIGVPTPPRRARSLVAEAAAHVRRQSDSIECATDNLANYEDALRTGDDWQGDNGLACCCHVPGGPTSKSDGTAKSSISENIRCPADPSGQPPPPSTCPLNCNEMRSYVYAIATQCKNGDLTGGTYHLPAGESITVTHS